MSIKGKTLLTMLTVVALLLVMKGTTAYAYVGSVFTYTYENQTLTYKVLTESTGSGNGTAEVIYDKETGEDLKGSVTIPDTVTNKKMTYDVVQIGEEAFSGAVNITSIKMPDKITAIGEGAFNNCTKLTSINIPEGVTGIEEDTFYGCSSLTNMDLPDSVTYIGSNAFTDCTSLATVNLPEKMNKIGSGAFWNCTSLKAIDIPEGITSIENTVFQDCTSLVTVNLPEGITSIGKKAFYNCAKLKTIYLPDSVTSIGEYGFYGCSSLTNINIPYKVTRIENRTFFKCTSLTKVILQDKLTSIGDFAFYNCTSLLSLELPESLTSIGNYSFYGGDSLSPLTIPRAVTSIGNGEFPYAGVYVYNNSYAKTFFQKYYPEYYQVVEVPLEEMVFSEEVRNIDIGGTLTLTPTYYPSYSSDITEQVTFSSSNAKVVSVDSSGKIKGLSAGEADITAVMGEYSATCHIVVGGEVIEPTSMSFEKDNVTMNKGESGKLTINITPENATDRAVTWSSSDSSVVSVENGYIYAKNAGTATITAKSSSRVIKCKVTVETPLEEIYSNYDEISLNKDETKTIKVSYYPMDTTDDTTTTWKSLDDSIVTVKDGVVTAIKAGTTKITATVGTLTLSIPVTVSIPAQSLSFKQTEVSLIAGQKQTLPLVVLPEDATDSVVITSSDDMVASYSDGTILAKKRGKATITAVCGSLSATCEVTVSTDIQGITLDNTSLDMNFGETKTLNVTYNPTSVSDDKTVTWTSSDKTVVTVDKNGKIQTAGTGKATITATAGGDKTAVCTVTVKLSLPVTIKAVSGGVDSAKISYTTVSGASGYEIYRAESEDGTYKKIKDTTKKSFTDSDLTTGKTYYYKVRAYRYKGSEKVYGSFTTVVNAKPVPGVPTNVNMAKLSSSRINFTWKAVSGASGYEVYRSSTKIETFQLVTTTTSLHYINYGLTKGRTYYYKVRAYKLVGNKKVYSKFSEVFPVTM